MKEKQRITKIVSRVLEDGAILELVCDGKKTSLCMYRRGEISMHESVQDGEDVLIPLPAYNNLIKHCAVLLPEKPSDYESEEQLIGEIQRYLYSYVDLSPEFLEVASAYVLFTWVYDAFNELCYLRFSGDFGSGKSRALYVLGSICNKPFFASAASTISPVFYTLDLFRGTLILDEADFRYSDMQSDIAKIMNNGSVKGFPVLRQTQTITKEFDPKAFNVYGPKIVAMRKKFEDIALESRFLTEDMGTRALREDIPLSLPDDQTKEAAVLRNKMLMYRFRTLSAAGTKADQVDRSRSGRFNQTVVPLLSIVSDERIRNVIRTFAVTNDEKSKGLRLLSIEAELVESICELIDAKDSSDCLSVGVIASTLRQKVNGDFERPITNRYVGQLLRGNLGLSTYKKHGNYVLPAGEFEKVRHIAKRFGLESDVTGNVPMSSHPPPVDN
ncbi:hypothetical protein [Rhodoferax sp. GW822-FHT02A01]|uniref:hypothetical protein n=1 Tax=Rhodoferax sp. GW822-FHT02A01 TaxID=3141537 RepID=UPI00315D5A0C